MKTNQLNHFYIRYITNQNEISYKGLLTYLPNKNKGDDYSS